MGDVQEYVISPEGMSPALPREPPFGVMATKQTHMQILSLMCLTSPPKPLLMNDWSHLLVANGSGGDELQRLDAAKAVQAAWQGELVVLANTIDERNSDRAQPFDKMNPRSMNSAVSV